MSKKFKKLLSIFMVTAMLLGTMIASPVSAEDEDVSYQTVDLTSFNNSLAYVDSTNYTNAPVKNDEDYFRITLTDGNLANYDHTFALDKDSVEELKVDGLVYSKSGIPFNWNTNGAVGISGKGGDGVNGSCHTFHSNHIESATVDIEDGNYSKLNFLAFTRISSNNTAYFTAQPFYVDLVYEDGTVSQNVTLIGDEDLATNSTQEHIAIRFYKTWNPTTAAKTTQTFDKQSTDPQWHTARVGIYTLELDITRTLKEVRFYNNHNMWSNWRGQMKVLAMTMETDKHDKLNLAISSLPEASEITYKTVASAQSAIDNLDAALEALNKTYSDLTEEEQTKIEAVKAKIAEVNEELISGPEYTTVNLTPFNNSLAYVDSTNYANAPVLNDEDYFRITTNTTADSVNYDHTFALDGDSVEELKEGGYVYSKDGIPFDWNTNGAVGISGKEVEGINGSCQGFHTNHIDSATVNIEDGNYSKLNFLAFTRISSTNTAYFTAQPFYVDLVYEDGTVSQNVTLIGDEDLATNSTQEHIAIRYYKTWNPTTSAITTQTFDKQSTDPQWHTARVGLYSLELDITKTLKEVRFYNNHNKWSNWRGQMKVLAMTMETDKLDKLNLAISSLPEASEISYKTVASAQSAVDNLDAALEALNKTYSDLTEEEQAKIIAVKEKIAEVNKELIPCDNYKTVDLTPFNNSLAYVDATNYTNAPVENDEDYFRIALSNGDANVDHTFALDRDSVEELKVDGLVYSESGIPFDWKTEGAVGVSGKADSQIAACCHEFHKNHIASATVNIEDGNYSKLNFLAFTRVTSNEYPITAPPFYVDLVYEDGTVKENVVLIGDEDLASSDQEYIAIRNYQTWNATTSAITKQTFNAQNTDPQWHTSRVGLYSLELDITRTLKEVKFYNNPDNVWNAWRCQMKVLALTLSNDGINTKIDELPEVALITADNAVEVKKALWNIEALMEEKGVLKADLTEERQAKLNLVSEACTTQLNLINSYVIANDFEIEVKNNNNGKLGITASAELINYIDEDKEVSLILGVYDGNKLAKNVEVKTITAKADGITALNETFEVSNFDDLTDGEIKVMLLGGLSSLKPLAPAKEYQRAEGIIGALNSNIKYTGRWEATEEGMRSHWSGAYAETIFTGENISVVLGDKATNFFAEIDGTKTLYENVSGTVNLTETPLSDGEHTLKIYGQSIYKNIEILGFVIDDGAELKSPEGEKLLIEFIGDSITSGQCDNNLVDVTTSYSWKLFANNSNIDRAIVAQPGITLVNDSDYYYDKGMAELYFKLDGSKTAYESVDYDVTKYSPDIIVVNIGTNDGNRIIAGITEDITAAKITSTMKEFLENVRTAHQNAEIFVLRPFHGTSSTELKAAVDTLSTDAKLHYVDTTGWLDETYYTSKDEYTDFYDNLHPTVEAHDKIATKLEAVIGEYITK